MPSSLGCGGNRLVCYLIFLSNLCLSNILWILQWTPSIKNDHDEVLSSIATKAEIVQTVQKINIQSFVISSTLQRAKIFQERNRRALSESSLNTSDHINSGLSPTWFPAQNGYDQIILDNYSQLTGFPALNASKFSPGDRKSKQGYETPHHMGCFMSHWHLLRLALEGWKNLDHHRRPDALWILEDDATCADSTLEQLQYHILPSIRSSSDWDMIYLGGKPISYHTVDPIHPDLKSSKPSLRNIQTDWTRVEFRKWACKDGLGRSSTGPFAPDGSRNLSLEHPYWRTNYITNTHSYVINPK